MNISDRINQFIFIFACGAGTAIAIEKDAPWWFLLFLAVMAAFGFFVPEILAEVDRQGQRLARWLSDRRQD